MIEYLLPVGIGVGGGVAALLFAKFRKPQMRENPLIISEDISPEKQWLIIFAGGKRVKAHHDDPDEYGVPYVGKVSHRDKVKDLLNIMLHDTLSEQAIELKNLMLGTNLLLPDGFDLTGGNVIYFCNVDAVGRVCEWNTTTAQKYMQQMSDITMAMIENEALEKIQSNMERKITLPTREGLFDMNTPPKSENR